MITDLTPEESGDYRRIVRAHGLDTIFLAAPTSPDERLARIAEVSSGFLYVISRTGVTGTKESLPEDLPALVRRVRRATRCPSRSVSAFRCRDRFRFSAGWPTPRWWARRWCRRSSKPRASKRRAALAERVRILKQAGLRE